LARIVFLDRGRPFDGRSLAAGPLGGIESATVQLAEALAARGHEVVACTNVDRASEWNGVRWRPLAEAAASGAADLAVANAEPRLLDAVGARRAAVWLHNPATLWKLVRTGRLPAVARLRPDAVLLGRYHAGTLSPLVPFRRRHLIPHGVGEPFVSAPTADGVPPPRALFTSMPYRGLADMVRLWRDRIRPVVPAAELHAYCLPADAGPAGGDRLGLGLSSAELAAAGIVLHPRASKTALAEALRGARVLLCPGHRDETFCLAAAEALAMGVPVATRGIGALRERVVDGETGVLAPDDAGFAAGVLRLLADDAVWRRHHMAALATRADASWGGRAALWEAAFL